MTTTILDYYGHKRMANSISAFESLLLNSPMIMNLFTTSHFTGNHMYSSTSTSLLACTIIRDHVRELGLLKRIAVLLEFCSDAYSSMNHNWTF